MANIDAGLVRGPQGPQGIKGDPFTYADFTESQITELQRPATEAAVLADKATKDAQAAIAEVKATEAKLYPAAENILKGNVKDTFVHLDDAFPANLLGIEIEGATEQVTTTGAQLIDSDGIDTTVGGLDIVRNADGSITVDKNATGYVWYTHDSNIVLEAGTYTISGATDKVSVFVTRISDGGTIGSQTSSTKSTFTVTETETAKIMIRFGAGYYNSYFVYPMLQYGSVATAYEPYTGGKQSPSPEYPQEINVIEHPVVKVTGRNLWPFASSCTSIEGHQNEFVNDKTPFTILPGTYTFSAAGSLGNTDAPLFGYTATGKRIQLFRIMRNVANPKYSFTVTEPIASIYFVSNTADSNAGTIYNIQLERNSTATEYKPYTSQEQAFTLPQEHPYLAKLQNGTADEISVDMDGNVELVARVGVDKDVRTISSFVQGKYYALKTKITPFSSYEEFASANGKGIVLCSSLPSMYDSKNEEGIYRSWNGIIVKDTSGRTREEIQAEIDKNAPLTVIAFMPNTRYQLGKIEMPKAQDSIVNAWTDAEVTPRTDIEYTRDVNIVVENLESAIASITQG